jgi:prophage regulatory protein
MAGPVIRLKDMITRTGLSRSVIYDRMNEKSPRYAKDFPKSFQLGGGAIGWFQNEVDAWLEQCARINPNAIKQRKPRQPIAQFPTERNATSKATATSTLSISVNAASTAKKTAKGGEQHGNQSKRQQAPNLADMIVAGGQINAKVLEYLKLKEWTPAMGAQLISGIAPSLDCVEVPNEGVGLDDQELCNSHSRLHLARRFLRYWHEWKEDSEDEAGNLTPGAYLEWCRDALEDHDLGDWYHLIVELAGMTEIGKLDLTSTRIAMLMRRGNQ